MGVLLIHEEAAKQIKQMIEFASRPENYYAGAPISRGDPNRFIVLGDYACVFTMTETQGILARRLTLKVINPHEGREYPHPIAAFTIAKQFGFTGWDGRSTALPPGWQAKPNKQDQILSLAQPVKMLVPAGQRN